MAVKTSHRSVGDFKRIYHRNVVGILVGAQTIVTASFGGMLVFAGLVSWYDPVFWIMILGVFSLGLGILLIFLNVITEPLDELLSALMHRIGEPTLTTPPNPNSKNYQSNGFKTVLQAIYDQNPTKSKNPDSTIETGTEVKKKILASALNNTSCGVVLLDENRQIIAANSSAPVAYDRDNKPFLALDFIEDEDIASWLNSQQQDALRSERRWQRISTDQQLIKKQRYFDIVASYERGAEAEVVIILIDQSDRYLPEEEDLNFVAFAAHELRGPITVIRGYLDVLEQELADRLEGDEPELLSRLTVSANRLSSYISNILNVIKFDRHHLQVHLYEDTAMAIYDSIADDMQQRAKAQHRLLSVDIPADLPTVAADRASISEVIGNLIDNAIKYSFEGGVISVNAVAKGDFIEFSVMDNGIGIPGNIVKDIFRKFYRSHRSRDAVAGSGIGLYICKALVESHGGSISVLSRENEGSTFVFSLPTYASVADKLLEDNQLNSTLIRRSGGWIKNHAMYRK